MFGLPDADWFVLQQSLPIFPSMMFGNGLAAGLGDPARGPMGLPAPEASRRGQP
jgi:hypothetical protein